MAQFPSSIIACGTMTMAFKERAFNEPAYEIEVDEPKRVVIISCEGRNTEPEYFKAIKTKLSEHISSLVQVDIVPKDDDNSAPQAVLDNLDSYIKEKYNYQSDYDKMWIVCDREKVDSRKRHINEIIPICAEKGYSLAITNPLFELWLLLHIIDINEYDKEILYKNEPISNKRKFLDKELSLKLVNGFNKSKGKFNTDLVTIENIKRALEQEKKITNEIPLIIDQIGSNIGEIIQDILPDL